MPHPAPRSPIPRAAWLTVLLLVAFALSGFYSSWQEYDLLRHSQTTLAGADDFRRDLRNRQTLRYHFQLAPGGPVYSCADRLGRTNLAVSARRATWDQARLTGTVAVRYDGRNPWNNELADDSISPWATAALSAGFLFLAYLIPRFLARRPQTGRRRRRRRGARERDHVSDAAQEPIS